MYSWFQESWVFSSWVNHVPEPLPIPLSLMFFFWYGITYKFQAHGTINLFLPSCLSFPAGSRTSNNRIYPISIYRYPVALGLWAPLRAPVCITDSQRKRVSLALLWQHTFWTLARASWYFSDITVGLTSSLTTFAKRKEVLAGHQEDHPYWEEGGRE